jgi:hypothetical protein
MGGDTNLVTLLSEAGEEALPEMPKEQLGDLVAAKIAAHLAENKDR